MRILQLTLKNFRCFRDITLDLDGDCVVLEGPNGSGKSSILEALHFACYLRSFRTSSQRELVGLGENFFFLGVDISNPGDGSVDQIHVGFSDREGKLVKFNQKPVSSYKDLLTHYRLVTLSEHDVFLVNGAPEIRRDFLTYSLLLSQPNLVEIFRTYRKTLEQRNALLMTRRKGGQVSSEEFEVWSEKLWQTSGLMRLARIEYLSLLQQEVNRLLAVHIAPDIGHVLEVQFAYKAKYEQEASFAQFWNFHFPELLDREIVLARSLFGAHLDDFSIMFHEKNARFFASRGQQKLLALLIKIAQLTLMAQDGLQGVLLLDDFMTDFDLFHVERCIGIIKSLQCQVFFTAPSIPTSLRNVLAQGNTNFISVAH